MTLAFVLYTTGVWAERAVRDLRWWHLVAFWLGLTADGTGTWMMRLLVTAGQRSTLVHTITGTAAFSLMALHATWATVVYLRGNAKARTEFHRYSLIVWLVWLVPYFGGMTAGIARGIRS
jgi:uncharacterized repeat protein (TIGR03987 family)